MIRNRPPAAAAFVFSSLLTLAAGPAARADIKVVSHVTANMMGTQGASLEGAGQHTSTVTMYYHGDRIRMESDNGMGHSVLLIDVAAGRMYTLKPATKTYTERSIGAGPPQASRMMSAMDVKTKALLTPIAAKKTIAGKPAHGYTFKATITVALKGGMAGMSGAPASPSGSAPAKPQPVGSVEMSGEEWVTDAVRLPGKGLSGAFTALGGGTSQLPGTRELTDKLAKIKGLPLAQTETIIGTGLFGAFLSGARAPQATGPRPKGPMRGGFRLSSEATSVTEGPLPASLFQIPAGYKKEDVVSPMPGAPGGRRP